MLKKLSLITLFIFISLPTIFSQVHSKYELILRQKFEEFDYTSVIKLADSILTNEQNLNRNDSLSVLYYKAISSFSIWDIKTSEQAFKNILILDENFVLDTITVSPKIVSYFNDLKTKYLIEKKNEKQNSSFALDSILVSERIKYSTEFLSYKKALWRNLVLPGWGSIYLNKKTKGYLFASAFTLSLISTIYLINDSNKKENDYLSEINPDLIPSKYSKYNSSYKLKNFSIALMALIYIYSQIDFLFIDESTNSFGVLNSLKISEDLKSNIKASISLPIKF